METRTKFPARFRARFGVGILLCSLLGLLPGEASAQTVVGTIVEAESGAPLVTAYLTLVSVEGEIVARALSDVQGRFTLRAATPGRYLVRAERIGRRSVTEGPLEVGDAQVVRVELRAESEAISLAGIEVTADQQCRLAPDEGVEMAGVWEQARLALQVEALARTERIFRYQLSNYTRELAPDARRVLAQQSRTTGGYLDAPYVSAPVEELLEGGWVREDPQDGGWTFFAPDAQVLLSDPFQGAHCFRLVANDNDASLIGLGFEPMRRSNRPGIEGALWLDRESAELRHLTFRYTAFPGAAAGAAVPAQGHGGRVEFLQLPGGLWVVNRWHIRMPVLDQVRGPRDTRIVLTGFVEEGGEVTEIRRASGGVVARLGRGAVEGTVVNGRTGAPLAGARVQLQGTAYEARTGPRGSFRLDGLRPGNYTLVLDPADEPRFLGALEPVQVAVEEDTPVQVELRTPSETALIEGFCAFDPPDPEVDEAGERDPAHPGMVEGLVTWADTGEAAAGLQVGMEERSTTLIGNWQIGRLVFDTRETRTWTTTRGWYGLCARPSEDWDAVRLDTFRLRVRNDEGRELYDGFVLPAPHRIVTRDVVVR